MSAIQPTLIGDDVENPANVQTLAAAAGLFGCPFLLRSHLDRPAVPPDGAFATWIPAADLAHRFSPLVALETLPGAASIYDFRLPKETGARTAALVVGNERRGIRRDVLGAAGHRVQIPLPSPRLNSLNVAAAAAVGLYYLVRGGGGPLQTRSAPHQRRPDVVLLGPADHVEAGSALRSAAAFGWGRVLVEDTDQVWFGRDRARVAESRAAARRHRNPLRVVPVGAEQRYAFDQVCVVTAAGKGTPLPHARLAGGPRQLVAIPDQGRRPEYATDWQRFAKEVRFVDLDLPLPERVGACYRYRLIATIALAEVARQVCQRPRVAAGPSRRHEPLYDAALRLQAEAAGEAVYPDELACF